MKDTFKIQKSRDGFWYGMLTRKGLTQIYGACVSEYDFLNPLYEQLRGVDITIEDTQIPAPLGAIKVYSMFQPFLLTDVVMKEYLKPVERYDDDYNY